MSIKTFSCNYCGVEIKDWRERKYCCMEHKYLNKKKNGITNCKVCGIEFEYKIKKRDPKIYRTDKPTTCSRSCYYKSLLGSGAPGWKGGIETRICKYCGKLYKDTYRKKGKFCSRECCGKSRKISIKKTCPICSNSFEIKPSENREINYCSRSCLAKHRFPGGETHPRYKRIKRNCETCGGNYEIIESRLGDNRFCSRTCRAKSRLLNNNPNWRGGIAFLPYGDTFNPDLREKIRRNYNFECQLCHKKQINCQRVLSIHHIDYDKNNTSLENLIPLCSSCHGKTNGQREYWKNYFLPLQSPV